MKLFPDRPLPKRFVKNIFEFSLFYLFSALARALPRPAALKLGECLGDFARRLLPQRRRVARRNLEQAFPEMLPSEVKKHVQGIFRHIGIGTMEMLRLDKLSKDRELQELFQTSGLEHLHAAYALNKGVFLLTGHLGFWESGTFLFPSLGFPVDFVVKPMKNPFIDRYLWRLREHAGGRCINSRQGARAILRSLSAGRGVAILLDQHVSPSKGIPVTFFEQRAYTTPIIAEMAIRFGVPIVPIFALRTADYRHRVSVEPMILADKDSDVATLSALLTSRIENAIRQDIDQWFWLHRRWR
jgi:KDO2-lipid IV(A) lauroyltransferase